MHIPATHLYVLSRCFPAPPASHSLTNSFQYNALVLNGFASNLGPNFDLVVPAQAFDEANDDQGIWALSIMSALESNFPALPCPAGTSTNAANGAFCPTSYLAVADRVFNLCVTKPLTRAVSLLTTPKLCESLEQGL